MKQTPYHKFIPSYVRISPFKRVETNMSPMKKRNNTQRILTPKKIGMDKNYYNSSSKSKTYSNQQNYLDNYLSQQEHISPSIKEQKTNRSFLDKVVEKIKTNNLNSQGLLNYSKVSGQEQVNNTRVYVSNDNTINLHRKDVSKIENRRNGNLFDYRVNSNVVHRTNEIENKYSTHTQKNSTLQISFGSLLQNIRITQSIKEQDKKIDQNDDIGIILSKLTQLNDKTSIKDSIQNNQIINSSKDNLEDCFNLSLKSKI